MSCYITFKDITLWEQSHHDKGCCLTLIHVLMNIWTLWKQWLHCMHSIYHACCRGFRYTSGVVWVHLFSRASWQKKQLQGTADLHLLTCVDAKRLRKLCAETNLIQGGAQRSVWSKDGSKKICQSDQRESPGKKIPQHNNWILKYQISLQVLSVCHRLLAPELKRILMTGQTGLVWSVQWGRYLMIICGVSF